MKPSVLVTGGAGYIGSHAAQALAAAGYLPVAYDNLAYGHEWAVQWGPLEKGDIRDRARLDEVIARHTPVAVMHFAAFTYVGESVTDPGKYYGNNLAGSLTLIEAARDHGITRFVLSSTAAVYGIPERLPIREDSPLAPINPYGASKMMVERLLVDFGAAHGLRSMALRYFNAAGADPATAIGEDHDPETHLLPLVLDAAAGLREAITVFGSDYPTPDGTCIRDYIHVTDLADAHVKALAALEGPEPFRALNLGNGQGFSVSEVIAAVERVTGRKVPVRRGARRAGDPASLVADAARAAAALAWTPRHARLDDIVRTAWDWHVKHHLPRRRPSHT